MVQVYSNPLPFDDCRVYRLRRPLQFMRGTLFPDTTVTSSARRQTFLKSRFRDAFQNYRRG
jgi:hypothetical protein